ncbi:MAG: lipopolysaccharide biosynthesis protein [Actinomycetota bacterium]
MTHSRNGEEVSRLARQSALLVTSGVVSYAGNFVLFILLARALGADGFGAWAVGFAVAKTFSTLGLMGADWIVLRHGSYYEGVGDVPRLRRTLHLSLRLTGAALLLLGGAVALGAPIIAHTVFDDPGFAPLLRVAGVMIPISGLGHLLLFGTQAFKQQNDYALIRNLLQPLLRLACIAAALVVARSELSAFLGLLAAESLLLVVSLGALNRRVRLVGPTKPIERRKLVRFAVPAWGTKIIDTSRGQLFPILLGTLASFSGVGAYVASQRVAIAPTAIITAMNQVYKPMGSDLFMQGRHHEFGTLFKSIGKWSFALGFPLFCLQVAFAQDILALFGEAFEEAEPALILLATGMLVSFGTGPVAVTLLMSGRGTLTLVNHIIVIVTEVALALLLIPPFGLIGAAVARMTGNVVNNGLGLYQVWRTTGLHPYTFDFWKPIVAGVASTGIAWAAVHLIDLPSGLASAAAATVLVATTYLCLLLLFGLSKEDREALQAIKKVRGRRPAARAPADLETSDLA